MYNVNAAAARETLNQIDALAAEVEAAEAAHKEELAALSARRSALVAQLSSNLGGAAKFRHPVSGREITIVCRNDQGTETYFLRGMTERKPAKKAEAISL